MKKTVFFIAWLLVSGRWAWTQEKPPTDSGTVVSQPKVTSMDTGVVAPRPVDTATAVPQPKPASADTGMVPQTPKAAPDTGAAVPHPTDTGAVAIPATKPPTDTTAASPQPPKAAPDTGVAGPHPADTGAVAVPPTKPPSDTMAAPPPKVAPAVPQAAAVPETAATKVEKPVRFGLGIVFNDEAPLAFRAWFNPRVGVDLGIGLRARRVLNQAALVLSPDSTTTLLGLSFDLGIPVRVVHKEKVDFIIRPGFGLRTRPEFVVEHPDTTVRSLETSIDLEVNGSAGFEYFPFERASFSLQAGVAVILERSGGDISNSILRVQSLPSEKGVNFSFRYYVF